ncbi:hypothetical protein [Bifidobacterium xylocopae]|uniref:hypothetical protein n=1 Tax=Bifidobacterium xylocopae TaxID=2493119 RepID=UPI000FDD5950|nr:hypothetical protein [Bifidobacterium xylocopae]
MSYQMVFKDGFLERAKRMSGLKTESAFAGALGVSESALSKAKRTGVASPILIVGLYSAFGFTPGEVATVKEVPDAPVASSQRLTA